MEVIVLAGGMGTRLRSVVHECPKCMAPVGDRPFLAFLLDWLCRYPVDHVVFSVGYLKEQVIDWVQEREWPFRYHVAVEETPLGTGGGIRLALGCCEESQVFVVNGDTFFPVDLQAMSFDGPVTIALKPLRDFDRYGLVSVRETAGRLQVAAFHEKAPCEAGLISGGVYALDRSRLQLLEGLPERFSFEKDFLEPGAGNTGFLFILQ